MQVWEIKAAELTMSPVYTAGSAYLFGSKSESASIEQPAAPKKRKGKSQGVGIGARFPRFVRTRPDK